MPRQYSTTSYAASESLLVLRLRANFGALSRARRLLEAEGRPYTLQMISDVYYGKVRSRGFVVEKALVAEGVMSRAELAERRRKYKGKRP